MQEFSLGALAGPLFLGSGVWTVVERTRVKSRSKKLGFTVKDLALSNA